MPTFSLRARRDEQGTQPPKVEHLHHAANLALELQRHRVVGLVDHEHVGHFEDAGLEQLHRVAAARLQATSVVSASSAISISDWPDADRLDDHVSLAEGVHEATASPVAPARPPRWPRLAIERMNTSGSVKCSFRRMRSPRIAPCENGELGSTDTTPTVFPARRASVTRAFETASTFRRPAARQADRHRFAAARKSRCISAAPWPDSAREIARASPRGFPASKSSRICASRRAAVIGRSVRCHSRTPVLGREAGRAARRRCRPPRPGRRGRRSASAIRA
jgi:hypothetical protein